MYESFFQLNARPFLASPLAERYFPAGAAEHARETAARCIERAEGPVLIIGGAGTGKSTICQVLAEQFRNQFRIATLSCARLCTRRALLQNILFELKLPYREREEGELRLSLIDFLEPSKSCPNGVLLLVDEAHTLPMRLLEEIRMITNLVRDGQPRVRLVLAANMMFEERLASPRMESFNQRIAARCYLQAMNRDETCEYVRAQIRAVGGDPSRILSEDALHAMFRATDGIPRLVNQLGDHVLMMAGIGRRSLIDASGVEEAWADLQQLPSPWSGDQVATSPGENDILEFGELDGETVGELDGDDAGDLDSARPVEVQDEPISTALKAEAKLNAIESKLASIAGPGGSLESTPDEIDLSQSEFHPTSNQGPEIELVFHQAHDPFNESFEKEEVVVDPFVSQMATSTDKPPARCDTGQNENQTIPFFAQENVAQENVLQSRDSDSGCDPVLPDAADVPSSCPAPESDGLEESIPGDDRDLLEVFDDEAPAPDAPPQVANPKPRRREYRQLFASLRARSQ